MQGDNDTLGQEFQELVFAASGAIQRLAHVHDRLGERLGEAGKDLPAWLDEAGALSVHARDVEEVPRLLVRIAEYLRNLRAREIDIDSVLLRGEESDWADIFADLVLVGAQFYGGAFEGATTPEPVTPTIKDLRDAIEHHADYLAGVGHKPALVRERQERLTFSYTLEPFDLRTIQLFGIEYEVGAAIEIAIQLAQSLAHLLPTPEG